MLFTFVLTYNGYAYTRQLEGDTLLEAFLKWQETTERIGNEPLKVNLKEVLEGERLAVLKGMDNVWAALFKLDGKSAMLNVVRTHGG